MPLFSLKGAFDEFSAKRYALIARTALEPLYERTVSELEQAAGREFSPKTIVDLGSGPGVLTEKLSRRFPGAEVTGVEPSRPMLAQAVAKAGPKLRFVEGSAEKIPLPDGSADLLVSHNSVKHWMDQSAGFSEIVRVLKPGGWLWLCEIDRDAGWGDSMRFCRPTGKPLMVVPFKLIVSGNGLRARDLSRLVKALPLSEVNVSPLEGLPMVRVLARRS